MVKPRSQLHVIAGSNDYAGTQDDFGESARFGAVEHRALRVVAIRKHADAGICAQMQVPELMACRDCGHKQIFGVPARRVPAKRCVGRARNFRLGTGPSDVVATVFAVSRRAGSLIAGPLYFDVVPMFTMCHRVILQFADIESRRGAIAGPHPPSRTTRGILAQVPPFGIPLFQTENPHPPTSEILDSTSNTVAVSLREMIVDGQFEPGERLVERDLADRFGVSRIPLREAIQQLEREGLVEIFRNRGASVRMLTVSDVNEIYDLRALLEGDAIHRSAKRMDEETLARAELVHRLLGSASTKARQGELNREFHELLYSKCGNDRQLRAIKELRAQVERYERLQDTLLDETPSFQIEHEEILRACKERRARDARSLIVAHLNTARTVVGRLIAAS